MPKVIQRTEDADSREVVFDYDDGSRVIHDTRTGAWTLFRIPSLGDILEAALGYEQAQIRIAELTKPVRYEPPTLADAPRHTAEVADEYGYEFHGDA